MACEEQKSTAQGEIRCFCSLQAMTSSVIYYSTDARKNDTENQPGDFAEVYTPSDDAIRACVMK